MVSRKLDSQGPHGERAARRGWSLAVTALCVGVILGGWSLREQRYLTPERGLGYGLGIAGSCAMLSILLYSLRKRSRALRGRGSMKHWMRAHIAMGLCAPIVILFHANFELGSTNSSVALIAMLLVAGSGIVGRFLYQRVNRGLHGQKRELERDWRSLRDRFAPLADLRGSEQLLFESLDSLTTWAESRRHGPLSLRALQRRIRSCRAQATRQLDEGHIQLARIDDYLETLRRTAELSAFEHLFRAWHALHIPIFVILLGTLAAHVIAVHLY